MSEDTWSLIATGIGQSRQIFIWPRQSGKNAYIRERMQDAEPYTNTLFDIAHGIALTDDELAEREEWVRDLMNRPEIDAEIDEDALDNWESNR